MKQATLSQASKIISVFEDMPSDQMQVILESGLLADLRDANIAKIDRDEFRRVCGLEPFNSSTGSGLLLEMIGTVILPAITARFVARDKFVVNTDPNAPVKISYLNVNFKEWFLSQTEEPIQGTVLCYQKLVKPSFDSSIIAELGGEAKAETTLTAMFSLMERQKHGENGVLLNNGYANIFYIKDVSGTLWPVCMFWRSDGWYVGAGGDPYGWHVGSRVFSRNS